MTQSEYLPLNGLVATLITTNFSDVDINNNTDPDAYVEKLQRKWAKGSRLVLLTSHIAGYSTAASEGGSRAQDYLDSVVNEYFLKFPWRLKVSEDPPDPVPEHPSAGSTPWPPENLSLVEMEQKRRKIVTMRKVSTAHGIFSHEPHISQAIRSWLEYRGKIHRKAGVRSPKNAESDPWARLLAQLSGVNKKKPKALQAHQRWSKDHFDVIVKTDFEAKCALRGIKGKALVTFREQVTREHFQATDEATQARYAQLAKDEAREAVDQWNKALTAPPNTDPVSRQAYGIVDQCFFHYSILIHSAIDKLPSFAGPFLSGIHAILGMHVTLLVGGPEPRKHGNITVLSYVLFTFLYLLLNMSRMHEGSDKAPIPRNWQVYDKTKYRLVTRSFQDYLANCYSTCDRY